MCGSGFESYWVELGLGRRNRYIYFRSGLGEKFFLRAIFWWEERWSSHYIIPSYTRPSRNPMLYTSVDQTLPVGYVGMTSADKPLPPHWADVKEVSDQRFPHGANVADHVSWWAKKRLPCEREKLVSGVAEGRSRARELISLAKMMG